MKPSPPPKAKTRPDQRPECTFSDSEASGFCFGIQGFGKGSGGFSLLGISALSSPARYVLLASVAFQATQWVSAFWKATLCQKRNKRWDCFHMDSRQKNQPSQSPADVRSSRLSAFAFGCLSLRQAFRQSRVWGKQSCRGAVSKPQNFVFGVVFFVLFVSFLHYEPSGKSGCSLGGAISEWKGGAWAVL